MISTSDPHAAYCALKADIDAAIAAVLEGGQYILGPVVGEFEDVFAQFAGTTHGIGVNSGTDALHLALRGLDIGPGDEVIAPSFTAVATVAAIEMAGATPVLVDVERTRRTIDPAAVAAAITPKSRAVIAVHLYGQPADLGALARITDARAISLIEDCAHAHGATIGGKAVGSIGIAGCFSFYPTKNLGALGDGGMVVTSDQALAGRLRRLRQYGWDAQRFSLSPGWNSRLDPLQAAILQVKLRHLPAMNARRRSLAARYDTALRDTPLTLPATHAGTTHAYHLYAVETPARDALHAHLARNGIAGGLHYAAGVHQQPAYAGRVPTRSLPETERLARRALSLPCHPELSEDGQQRVIEAIRQFFATAGAQ